MIGKVKLLNKIVIIIVLVWSLILSSFTIFIINENYTYADNLALNEAIISTKKDLAYRSWVASHGGVYVPITKRTPPNPYLSHLSKRDIITSDGDKLTLMNPAYTISQMSLDYSRLYGVKGHITSNILLNPKNMPDEWELKALNSIEKSREPFFEKSYINSEEYLRYLNPLVTKESCLKCHGFQGYRVGDIRGGVSVSIPMKEFDDAAFSSSIKTVYIFLLIWLIGIVAIYIGYKRAKIILKDKIKDYEQHIYSLIKIIEKRDNYTAGHSQRVADYSVLIAKEINISDSNIDKLYRACMLHDIGKISTPDSILLKPDRLSSLEFDIIKEHVVTSYEILKDIDIYRDIANIVRYHHERYDGYGYPNGLKGDEIPLLSQIMSIADSFDAMTTNRVYKSKKSVKIALDEILELGGKQFNSELSKVAFKVLQNVEIDEKISQYPQSKIESERFAYFYKDKVTGLYNRDYLKYILSNNSHKEYSYRFAIIISLNNFTLYNKKYSWSRGDELLKSLGVELSKIDINSITFRVYGDRFIILSKNYLDMEELISNLKIILENEQVNISYKSINLEINNLSVDNFIDNISKS